MYTKRPNFNNFGRFFVSKNKKIRVHTKRKKPGDEPGFALFPGATPGLSQQCGAKVMDFSQNLAYSCKYLSYPIQERHPFPI